MLVSARVLYTVGGSGNATQHSALPPTTFNRPLTAPTDLFEMRARGTTTTATKKKKTVCTTPAARKPTQGTQGREF